MLIFLFPQNIKAEIDISHVKSVVKIKIWDKNLFRFVGHGSGVVVDMMTVLTNYHVIEDTINNPQRYVSVICTKKDIYASPNCSFVGSATNGIFGENIATFNKELDLALLSITGKINNLEELDITTYLELTASDILPSFVNYIKLSIYGDGKLSSTNISDNVETLGFPAETGGELSYSNGEIVDFMNNQYGRNLRIVTSARITPGSSGGAAFDFNGKFLGVTTGYYANDNDEFLFGSIIPVTIVNWWMQELQGYRINKKGEYTASESSDEKIEHALSLLANEPMDEEIRFTENCNNGNVLVSFETICENEYGQHSKRTFEFNNDGGFNVYCTCESNDVLSYHNNFAKKLSGKILLQVEKNGEAWYVNHSDNKKYYLGRPADAFSIMKNLGIGITNNNLAKIQIADMNLLSHDSDNDGLSDMVEDAIGTNKNNNDSDGDGYSDKDEILRGYNPNGDGKIVNDNFASKQKGKILLQVESHGEAWYINPNDGKRYFLGRPADAFNVMRNLGLGITNDDIGKIEVGEIVLFAGQK